MLNNIIQYFNKKKLTQVKYEYLFNKYEGDELVCFDCETTGLNPKIDDIISIGAVKIKGNNIDLQNKFEKLVLGYFSHLLCSEYVRDGIIFRFYISQEG